MRIDAARQHELAAGVDDPGGGRRTQAGADLGDGLADDANIGVAGAVGVDHPSAANQYLRRWLGSPRRERRGGETDRSCGHRSQRVAAIQFDTTMVLPTVPASETATNR